MDRTLHPGARRPEIGMSLVELMVAVSIISIGLLAFTSSFRFISHSIRDSRARSLAISLAQEKIENLKDIPYHKLQLTTVTVTNSHFSPAITYDAINYPPETIRIGGITYTRGMYVSLTRLTDNEITATSSLYPDSGLKFVTTYVMWEQRGEWKKYELENLYENPNVDPLDATLQGVVKTSAGTGLPGATVTILEKQDWNGTSGTGGSYLFRVHAGTYSIRASSAGFYDSTLMNVLIDEGALLTTNFSLIAVGSGAVSGNVFISSHLVVSQVVVATDTRVGDAGDPDATAEVEFVMLFNPTTYQIDMTANWWNSRNVPYYYNPQAATSVGWWQFMDVIHSTYISPNHGYVVASSSWFMVDNQWIRADANYNNVNASVNADLMSDDGPGSVMIYDPFTGFRYDKVGWSGDTYNITAIGNSWYEGTPLADAACADGIGKGNFIIRFSSPGVMGSGQYSWSYDTGDNSVDFVGTHVACAAGVHHPLMEWNGLGPLRPFSMYGSSQTQIGGIPAVSAFVIADDLLAQTTIAYQATLTNMFGQVQPFARYSLTGVSTGTWTVFIATGDFYTQISSVVVPLASGVSIPNSVTTPVQPGSGVHIAAATQTAVGGYLSGLVLNTAGSAIPNISVIAGGNSKTTGANGRFFAPVSVGPQTLIVNPNNANSVYSEYVDEVTVARGQVNASTITLSQAGTLTGFITPDGTSGLPNIEVTANRAGAQWGAGVTDTSGAFYIKNLSTGTYDVQPVLDPLDVWTPSSFTVTTQASRMIHVGTFTVTGAEGKLGGAVTYNGSAVTIGALILVSTATLPSTPPAIVASSSPAQAVIYAASSKADGTYLLDVRGSTTTSYRVHAYVPVVGPTSVTISTKVYTGVIVYSTGTTTLNIAVP
ncbi:MAG: carboxypeptidase regulatory-like domain-containing protein [Elusimicrobia bacterium]|nr:carboxypeptidase regulatory-like domain-containing protein [Elusimicrobiota bacterium]